MKKYVINLERRPDRLQKFQATCPFDVNQVEVIKGFDGASPDTNEYGVNEYPYLSKRSKLRTGEKGVFLSHIQIWKDIIEKEYPHALIMEDDPIFCDGFIEKYEKVIGQAPENFDLLYVGGRFEEYYMTKSCEHVSELIVKHKVPPWVPLDHDRGAFCYVVSHGLAKLITGYFLHFEKWDRLFPAIDHFILRVALRHGRDILSAQPMLCYGERNAIDSDIQFSEFDYADSKP